MKHMLAFPTWGQKHILSELQPFEVATFDLGHPVVSEEEDNSQQKRP